jgi:hypothetical protein
MDKFKVEHIRLRPFGGVDLTDCLYEATILALTECRNVVFEFSGRRFEIVPEEIILLVEEKDGGTNGGRRG